MVAPAATHSSILHLHGGRRDHLVSMWFSQVTKLFSSLWHTSSSSENFMSYSYTGSFDLFGQKMCSYLGEW